MALYRKSATNREEARKRREREQAERLERELREIALRELRSAAALMMRDMEKELAASLSNINLGPGRTLSDTGSTLPSGAQPGSANWASLFGATLVRLLSAPRERTRVTQSAATETARSEQDNQFYRESRSQREAAISTLGGSGSRNL